MMRLLDLRRLAQLRPLSLRPRPELRAAAVRTWRGRMVNEHQSAAVFAGLSDQAARTGLATSVVQELREFAAEERRHGALCGSVVEALGDEARAAASEPRALPAHEDVPAHEGFLRNVLSVSCLSETVAVALIGAERLEMPEGPLRDLLTEIWSDEIGHARFGWRVARELTNALEAPARQRISAYLRVALCHLELHELSHLPLTSRPGPDGAALGLCSGADARRLFYETVTTAILPALAELGLDAQAAWDRRREAEPLVRGQLAQ